MPTNFPDHILDSLKTDLEEIGVYILDGSIGGFPASGMDLAFLQMAESEADAKEIIEKGVGEFYVHLSCEVRKLAWTDRVLNPEKFAEDTFVRSVVPNELEAYRSMVADEGLFKWDDDEEDR